MSCSSAFLYSYVTIAIQPPPPTPPFSANGQPIQLQRSDTNLPHAQIHSALSHLTIQSLTLNF
jgi:hypothetical protein